MPLVEAGIVRYLIDQGLVQLSSVVDGALVVIPSSRQHRNFLIRSGELETSYFVKQPGAKGEVQHSGIAREASFYWLVASHEPFTALRELLPRYRLYDPSRSVLVLEEAKGVAPHRRQSLENGFPPQAGAAVGRALAEIHKLTPLQAGNAATMIAGNAPWVLSILEMETHNGLPRNPGTEFALNLLGRHPGFKQALARLRESWGPQHLTHGDMKWDNCLVDLPDETSVAAAPGWPDTTPPTVRLLDWETAAWGDPAWDVGSLIQDYVSQSVLSSSLPAQAAPDAVGVAAEEAMVAIRPAVAAFWLAYAGVHANPDLLLRSIGYAGARILQTCIEVLSISGVVTPNIAALLQLSHHILERPDAAAISLLGFR